MPRGKFFDGGKISGVMQSPTINCPPDLKDRPHAVKTARLMQVPAEVLYAAFTTELDRWFAAPGTVLMRPEVNVPFYFETVHQSENDSQAERSPHYGRFLRLEPGHCLQMTWVSGPEGTGGVETVLTIELAELGAATDVRLTHEGFADEATADQHAKAWPFVLAQLECRYGGSAQGSSRPK